MGCHCLLRIDNIGTSKKWNDTVFLSLSIMSSRFIHVVTYVRIFFLFFRMNNFPLYVVCVLCMFVYGTFGNYLFNVSGVDKHKSESLFSLKMYWHIVDL